MQLGWIEGESILLPQLIGVAFYPSDAAATAAPDPGAGVSLHHVPVLDPAAVQVVGSLFIGEPVSRAGLDRLAVGVRSLLSQAGYPFSLVSVPPQDITSGVVRLVVTVARLETTVQVQGVRYFSPGLYQRHIHLRPGQPLSRPELNADIAWINRNPFRAARATVVPGDEAGTSQILVQVNETLPWRFFAGADNTGTASTKEERFNAGFNWGNVWGLGHQLTAQWNSSWDFDTMRSGSGSYVIDLPWRHTLSFSGAYSRTNGLVAPPFALKGTSWQIAANYDLPLASPSSRYSHAWQFGIDFKSSDNNFTFASIPITDNLTHVVQARASYAGQLTSAWGFTSFRATVTGAPGDLTDRNKTVYFQTSRAGAQADYLYLRANASHAVQLDRIKKGVSWTVCGQFQLADHNLIGSEQFGAGGSTTVRGYEEGEVYKDNGGLLSQELRLPPWSPVRGHSVQLYLFEDYAYLWSTEPLTGERASELHSAGLGADYFVGRHLSLRAAYGWQMLDSGSSESGDNARLHVSAHLSF